MMSLNNQSVNVSRVELIKCLNDNLKIHQKEYKQAIVDYQKKIKDEVNSLKKRLKKVISQKSDLISSHLCLMKKIFKM